MLSLLLFDFNLQYIYKYIRIYYRMNYSEVLEKDRQMEWTCRSWMAHFAVFYSRRAKKRIVCYTQKCGWAFTVIGAEYGQSLVQNAYKLHFLLASLVTFTSGTSGICLSGWPRGLRRGSAAARLLGWRVRISQGTCVCLSVLSVVCCQVEVSATDWSLVQRSLTKWVCVFECDRWPNRGCRAPLGLHSLF